MAGCRALDPAAGPAQKMLSTVDCFMQSNVQSGYASLLGQGSSFGYILTIALTLYVAVVGYRLIFGRSSVSIGEMVPRLLLIGAILALTSSWATYQTLVYNVLTDGPEEIATMVSPSNGQSSALSIRIDLLSTRMVELADAWSEFDARVNTQPTTPQAAIADIPPLSETITNLTGPRDSFGPNMLLLSGLLLVLASAGVVVVAKIILGILLMMGPVFAVMALFPSTRGLTLGWARAAILMALVPLMAMLTSAGAVAMLEPLVTDMILSAGKGVFSLTQALTILVVVLITLAVAIQLFRVGRTIVSGWTLSAGQNLLPAQDAQTQTLMVTNNGQTSISQPVYNERVQSIVNSIERSAMSLASSPVAVSVQRSILMSQSRDTASVVDAGGRSGGNGNNPDRRISYGRPSLQRAPIKPFRNAA